MGNAASFWVRAHTVQRDYTWELRRDEDSLFPPLSPCVAVADKNKSHEQNVRLAVLFVFLSWQAGNLQED